MTHSIDRRFEPRLEACLDAVLEATTGNYNMRVTDISEGGCYIDSVSEAAVGEVIRFRLKLPTGRWLHLSGRVAHHFVRLGFGLQFVDLDAEQLRQIRSLIAYLQKNNSKMDRLSA